MVRSSSIDFRQMRVRELGLMEDFRQNLQNDYKVYIDVFESRLKDGRLIPHSFIWEDGRQYEEDKIMDIRPAASLKAGGAGLRYTVRVWDRETFLFLEEDGGLDRNIRLKQFVFNEK